MVIGIPWSFATQYIDFPLRTSKAMFTLVRFRFSFSFQLSSKRMSQTQAIAAHVHASHVCAFIFLFPFNLLFLFPFNFHQSACLRHKQYMSTFMHYIHQPRSIPMAYVSLVTICAMTYAFDEHKNAQMWTSIMYPLVLWRMPSMNVKITPIRHACSNTCDTCITAYAMIPAFDK